MMFPTKMAGYKWIMSGPRRRNGEKKETPYFRIWLISWSGVGIGGEVIGLAVSLD